MTQFIPFSRDQAFLLPPDAKDWLPADDVAHFVIAAVERVPLGAFAVGPVPGGKAQYHPRRLLALLIYCYANGIFSSRRIERATLRDIGVRYVAANLHPDHDTIAAFRQANRAAFEAKAGRRRGHPPKPPEDDRPATRQSNLTDPDSALMRRSDAQEYR